MAPLISLTTVSKAFGTRPLFRDISLVLEEGDRTALIGPNGAGKSTLFKVIAGLDDVDDGQISLRKGLQLAYVPQMESLPENESVENVLRGALDDHSPDREALVSRYAGKAGFIDRQQKVSALSGGWRKRLSISCALIREPEILLLDEPTNHLDIESIIWLEDILLESESAVVFVSHDRYFIERVAKRVVELDRVYPKGFLSSDGSYSNFLETREMYLTQRESYKSSLENKVRREVEWLRQGVKARGTKARGRIQQAGRLIDELGGINLEKKKAEFQFSDGGRRTKELIHLEHVSKKMGERFLFKNLTVTISPGTRLGIAGSNGTGKTTLLKTILGILPVETGKIRTASLLKVAYFDQKRMDLDPNLTLRKALCPEGDSIVFAEREIHVVTWARKFLFNSDHLDLPIKSLSGGERARVLLARLMSQPADLLVMDEPTNDLDIPTLEVLEETLCEFPGAVVLVTHDRHLLDKVCTQVIGLTGDGHCAIYADYTQWEIDRQSFRKDLSKEKEVSSLSSSPRKKDSGNDSTAPAPKLTYAERLELDGIEEAIAKAEEIVSAVTLELSSPEHAKDQSWLVAKCDELAVKEKIVEDLYARWQTLEQKRAKHEASSE